ncbi:MAG: GWxTD domain-containing protein [Bacteroidota bacterium]|nr:GWxTD domain-containing protein [Bacteroidota bacterium]
MKKVLLISLVFLTHLFPAFSAGGLKSYLSYSVFYSPEKGPYLETNLTVAGSSMIFKGTAKKVSASVNVFITFSDANKKVEAGNNYNLITPTVHDTAKRPSLVDVQRFFLKPGKYTMEITLMDKNSGIPEKYNFTEEIEIKYIQKEVNMSDIELVESFEKTVKPNILSKSGYDLIPYSINYYPEDITKLIFYNEAYGTDTVLGPDKRVAMVYYLESSETLEKIDGFFSVSKQKSQKVNMLFSQIDIKDLITGNYNLVTEVRDEKGLVLGQKKLFFQRRNSSAKIDLDNLAAIDANQIFSSQYTNNDTLKSFIECLWPISTSIERDWQETQIKNADAKLMQQYIYAFWKNRNDKSPEEEWIKYYKQVLYVNKVFSCGKMPGYFTDRGRVYLQYGPPDSQQMVTNESDSYPYDIWQYYRLKDPATGQFQTNRKFIYWNRDLDGTCFKLLHSDARGEVKETRWQLKLKQRTQTNPNLDVETPGQNTYGSGVDDLFTNPR